MKSELQYINLLSLPAFVDSPAKYTIKTNILMIAVLLMHRCDFEWGVTIR